LASSEGQILGLSGCGQREEGSNVLSLGMMAVDSEERQRQLERELWAEMREELKVYTQLRICFENDVELVNALIRWGQEECAQHIAQMVIRTRLMQLKAHEVAEMVVSWSELAERLQEKSSGVARMLEMLTREQRDKVVAVRWADSETRRLKGWWGEKLLWAVSKRVWDVWRTVGKRGTVDADSTTMLEREVAEVCNVALELQAQEAAVATATLLEEKEVLLRLRRDRWPEGSFVAKVEQLRERSEMHSRKSELMEKQRNGLQQLLQSREAERRHLNEEVQQLRAELEHYHQKESEEWEEWQSMVRDRDQRLMKQKDEVEAAWRATAEAMDELEAFRTQVSTVWPDALSGRTSGATSSRQAMSQVESAEASVQTEISYPYDGSWPLFDPGVEVTVIQQEPPMLRRMREESMRRMEQTIGICEKEIVDQRAQLAEVARAHVRDMMEAAEAQRTLQSRLEAAEKERLQGCRELERQQLEHEAAMAALQGRLAAAQQASPEQPCRGEQPKNAEDVSRGEKGKAGAVSCLGERVRELESQLATLQGELDKANVSLRKAAKQKGKVSLQRMQEAGVCTVCQLHRLHCCYEGSSLQPGEELAGMTSGSTAAVSGAVAVPVGGASGGHANVLLELGVCVACELRGQHCQCRVREVAARAAAARDRAVGGRLTSEDIVGIVARHLHQKMELWCTMCTAVAPNDGQWELSEQQFQAMMGEVGPVMVRWVNDRRSEWAEEQQERLGAQILTEKTGRMPDEAWLVRRAVDHGVLRFAIHQEEDASRYGWHQEEVLRVGMQEATDLERSFRDARVQMLLEMAEWLSNAEAPVAVPCTSGLQGESISLGPMEMMEVALAELAEEDVWRGAVDDETGLRVPPRSLHKVPPIIGGCAFKMDGALFGCSVSEFFGGCLLIDTGCQFSVVEKAVLSKSSLANAIKRKIICTGFEGQVNREELALVHVALGKRDVGVWTWMVVVDKINMRGVRCALGLTTVMALSRGLNFAEPDAYSLVPKSEQEVRDSVERIACVRWQDEVTKGVEGQDKKAPRAYLITHPMKVELISPLDRLETRVKAR